MNNPLLSVVIPTLDDPDIANTVRSIRETAPEVEIVVVDDCSTMHGVQFTDWCEQQKGVKLVRNRQRCGSGPSRHIGGLYASGDWLLHTDSHMRFYPGWYEAFRSQLQENTTHLETMENYNKNRCLASNVVGCGTMIALEPDLRETGEYTGATLNLVGHDPGDASKDQIFQANWKGHKNGDDVAMLMGACTFVNRDWYLSLSPHRHLRNYGFEEEMLSLKTWLSGGRIKMLSGVRIGHIFRGKDKNRRAVQPPYEVPLHHLLYNKLFAMWTLLPFDLTERLLPKLEKITPRQTWLQATELIRQDWHLIAAERAESQFKMTFAEYCEKFHIPLP